MSSGSAAASSQHSSAQEVQPPIDLVDSDVSIANTPSPLPLQASRAISTRTRSKAKVLNPDRAIVAFKTSPFSHKSKNTKLALIQPTSSGNSEPHYASDNESSSNPNLKADPEVEVETSVEDIESPESPCSIPACENLDTTMNANRLKILLQKCQPQCQLVIPSPGERCHRFDMLEPDQVIPSAVFSATFFRMGISIPLHPFIHDILRLYDLAPLQMTPNAYRMAMCMYILYNQEFDKKMSARELGFFYQLKQTSKDSGFFYLAAWNVHEGQCIRGSRKGMTDWLPQFLYCYDCPSYRTSFNKSPSKFFFINSTSLKSP